MRTRNLTCVVVLALIAIGLGRGVRSYAQEGGDGPPAIGSPVAIIGVEGTEVAQITVTEVEDPFEDFDPGSPPDTSYHYVLVHLDVENTGTRPYLANAYGVSLQDADGFLYLQSYLFRTEEQIADDPDFPNEEIAPGNTTSGVVAFQVLDSANLVRIVYQPAYDRLFFLADLTQEGAPPPADDDEDAATPASDDDADTGEEEPADVSAEGGNAGDLDSGDDDDADSDSNVTGTDIDADADDTEADADDTSSNDGSDGGDTASVDVSADDCDDIQEWLETVTPELDVLSETLDDVAAEDPITVDTLEDAAADLQEAADNLRDSDPPELMEESAELLADALDSYADLYLDAAEAGDDISVEEFFTNLDFSEPDALLTEVGTASDPILEACGIDA